MNDNESFPVENHQMSNAADELLLQSRLEAIKAETNRCRINLEVMKSSPYSSAEDIINYETLIESNEFMISQIERLNDEFQEEAENIID